MTFDVFMYLFWFWEPLDGVVLIDPDYLKERKVFGHVLAAFRYGREDLDVLGLTFRKDLYLASEQIYPQKDDSNTTKRPLTRLQERLVKKLGTNAFPFFFEVNLFIGLNIRITIVFIEPIASSALSGISHFTAGTGRYRKALWC